MALAQDLRYGVRTLARSPGFTVVAVLALALGIGANTAIFSVVNAVLLRPLPYRDADRLTLIWENNLRQGWTRVGPSGPNFIDWREQSQLFEEMALMEPGSGTLTGLGEPEQIPGMRVTTNFLNLLGARAQYGRLFTADEVKGGRPNVAIVTHGFVQRRLGADTNIVGRQFQVDGLSYTVVGVLSPDFWLPLPADAFVPWPDEELRRMNRMARNFGVMGRLKPGVTIEQAEAELNAIAGRLAESFTGMQGWGVTVVPLKDVLVEYIRPALLILLGAVAFVLLIACTNIANLLLARGAGRQKEIAIRAAMGAGRGRLVRQFLTESVLLGLAGGALGLLLAFWGIRVLTAVLPQHIPIPEAAAQTALAEISIDWRVLAFALLVSALTGILFGLAPALAASRNQAGEALKEGGRASSLSRHPRLRDALVVAEVALALVLLIGAGLMVRSFVRLQQVNPGFNPERILTFEIELPTDSRYREPREWGMVFERFLAAVENIPGLRSAALTRVVPMSGGHETAFFDIEGRAPLAPGERLGADFRPVSPQYFRTLGIPLLSGRALAELDHADAAPVVVIDRALARRYWPDEDPIGRRITLRNRSWEVVGVVGEIRHAGLNRQPQPTIYAPFAQAPFPRMNFVLRTAADPAAIVQASKEAVWAVDKNQPIYNVKTMDEIMAQSASAPRFTLLLLGVFAGSALALAGLGIYGVLSYSVTQRLHEIGIRMALGAQTGDVLRLVVGRAVLLALAGIGIGVAAALALTQVLSSLLFEVSPTDPATFLGVALVLTSVALLAGYLPARRATRVDPIRALRYE